MVAQPGDSHGPSNSSASIQDLLSRGVALAQAGKMDDAAGAFREALAREPGNVGAHINLGNVLQSQGLLDAAVAAYQQALQLNPDQVVAHNNLGMALREQGKLEQAVEHFRVVMRTSPDNPGAHYHLGSVLEGLRRYEEAEECFRKAVALAPELAEAHNGLGLALMRLGRFDEAEAQFQMALKLAPQFAEVHSNLGLLALARDKGAHQQAIAHYRDAIALKPDLGQAHYNLGNALQDIGAFDDSAASHRRAIALNPNYAQAHNDLAVILLRNGEFAEGWAEYEWRWQCVDLGLGAKERYAMPSWSGELGSGGAILLWSDQGMGDAIQCVRYAHRFGQYGWSVILGVQKGLKRLFETIPGVSVIAEGEYFPEFYSHAPLLSVPGLLDTTVATIPATIPYLHADPELSKQWRAKLDGLDGVKIGLVWRGNPDFERNYLRSMTADQFASFIGPGVSIVSLQRDVQADELERLGRNHRVFNAGHQFEDMADTAAAIANLDLVISVDTGVCHLAGAVGAPVWTLLDFVSDWRWLRDRTDSPWYPTMRLFRQPALGDWNAVIATVKAELSSFVAGRVSSAP